MRALKRKWRFIVNRTVQSCDVTPPPVAWHERPSVRTALAVVAAAVSAVAAVLYLAPKVLGDWETIYEYSPMLLGFVGFQVFSAYLLVSQSRQLESARAESATASEAGRLAS